ncbi:GNAT family N-acetyltransferase [Hoeflea sp. WL0058]|uniref:GNAT family N-acetyltransferase n=1 Tax=Flavimaribacter sediminis TaxID=2865987 RepID=A0AAE3CZV4_9HYPH|nr:GNAT family N-acetyltransferase [Flavimaribacter sediminis]MBW8637760.1 GNAT family N-acetyltransferase [Flavimaribacter sediminis]
MLTFATVLLLSRLLIFTSSHLTVRLALVNAELARLNLQYISDSIVDLVRLRKWHSSDVEWYSRLIADPDVMRLIGDGKPRTADAAALEIERFQHEQKTLGHSRWVGYVLETGEPIGFIGFSERRGEIDWGGRAFRKFWGTRYMVCSAILALDHGLTCCNVPQAVAVIDKTNHSTLGLNAKLGFRECGEGLYFNRRHNRQSINRGVYITQTRQSNMALLKRLSRVGRSLTVPPHARAEFEARC